MWCSLFTFSLILTPIWRVYLFFGREGMCVCMCVREHVCVCMWAQIWSRHQSWEIWAVIGHLCLTDFILFRHLKWNGLEPEIGSGVCLCVGKVFGTPQHPLRNGYLPSNVLFYLLSLDLLVYVQMSRFPSCDIPRMANANWLRSVLIRLFISPSFIFIFFRFRAVRW